MSFFGVTRSPSSVPPLQRHPFGFYVNYQEAFKAITTDPDCFRSFQKQDPLELHGDPQYGEICP